MRGLLAIAAVLAVTTVPLGLAADTPSDGTLSVKRGRGTVVLKLKGTVIGRVARNGRVQIRDFRPFDANDAQLTCRPHVRQIRTGIWLCTGRNIGFRIDKGRFNVNVRGTGISISAIGHGNVTVDGADGVARVLQVEGDEGRDRGLVLDHQHRLRLSCHGTQDARDGCQGPGGGVPR